MPVELWPADAAPDGVVPHPRRQVVGHTVTEELTASLLAEIADRGASHGARPRRRAAARQGALGLELVARRARRSTTSSWWVTSRSPGATASSRSATTCPSGCCRREVLAGADPDAGGRGPRAGPARRPLARGRHRALPARLLPDAARSSDVPAGRRRPGRGRRAAAGADRGLAAAGVPAPRRPAAAPGRRPGAAQPVRPGGLGARADRAALRLPLPDRDLRPGRASGCTATTCCRSCSATGSSAGSTSRPTGSAGRLRGARRRTPSRARPTDTAEELSARSWTSWPAGWGSTEVIEVEPRGRPAPARDRAPAG